MRTYLALWVRLLRLSLRRQTRLTVLTLAALAASVVMVPAAAVALRDTINAMAAGNVSGAVSAAVLGALAYAANFVLLDATALLRNTITDRIGRLELHPSIYADLSRIEGLEHLERADFLDRVTAVGEGYEQIAQSLWNVVLLIVNGLKLAVTVVLLGAVSPWLVFLLLFAAVPVWWENRGQRHAKRVQVDTAEGVRLQRHLTDLLVQPGSGKEIRVAGSAERLMHRQTGIWADVTQRRYRAQLRAAWWKFAGWAIFVAGFVGGLLLIVYRYQLGHGTVGDLALAVLVAARLRHTVQSAATRMNETAGAGRLLDPWLWLQAYTQAQRWNGSSRRPPPENLSDGITLEDVSFAYPGTTQLALERVTVRLPAGSVVAIVGEYGSGKTTLVKLLCSFYRPGSGRILVDGINLAEIDTPLWRLRTSAAFQDFGRFHTSFAENVGIGDLPAIGNRERIAEAVRQAGGERLLDVLPQGLSTQLGRELGGIELSEGQWQQAALARSSMRRTPLLFVLDEPTASLDAPSEQEIFARYVSRARSTGRAAGAITVMVSHRFSTVVDADLILVMHQGRIIEVGSHDDLLSADGKYAELFSLQAQAYSAV